MRILYSLVMYCLLPVFLIRLFALSFSMPAYRSRWRERLGYVPSPPAGNPLIWIHAVSVGEVQAATTLIRLIDEQLPSCSIVVSTVTPTGADTLKKHFQDRYTHFYLPYDLPGVVERMLQRLMPDICIIMETEIWPNLYYYCKQRNIPVVIANARLSVNSLSGYKKVPTLVARTLAYVDRVVAQSKVDATRFHELGCNWDNIKISGNLKFDVSPVSEGKPSLQENPRLGIASRPVWVAASSHEGEEELILDAYEWVLKEYSNCLLILAPRHPQRFDKVASLCRERGYSLNKLSEIEVEEGSVQILMVDSIGELHQLFPLADAAFIGGSLVAGGGHNMLEPAAYGKVVLTGVNYSNFQEVAELMLSAKAMFVVNDPKELAEKLLLLLADDKLRTEMGENALQVVKNNSGAARMTVEIVQELLS